MRKIVLNDTNIIIDLMSVDIFRHLFRLPWEVHVTDMVLAELKQADQSEMAEEAVGQGCILVDTFSSKEVGEISERYEFISQRTNLSPCDCSVWYASEKRGYTVLTGDKKLRTVVEESGIEVHGILYVLNAMVDASIIAPDEAIRILTKLQSINCRLPKEKSNNCKTKWESLMVIV